MAIEDSNNHTNPLEELFSSIKDYLGLRIDEIKLTFIENLSKIFSRILLMVMIVLAGALIVGFLAVSFSLWIGGLLGSAIYGHLITAGVLLLIIALLLLFRNRIFMNTPIRMFTKMFFNDNNDGKDN